jgi:hypothetical protein
MTCSSPPSDLLSHRLLYTANSAHKEARRAAKQLLVAIVGVGGHGVGAYGTNTSFPAGCPAMLS